jgi:hypothetical protein
MKMSERSLSFFEKNLSFMGWALICTGIVCNELVLTKILSPDGMVEIQNRVAVWLFDILLISLGACPRISVISSLNPGLACQLRAQMGHDL